MRKKFLLKIVAFLSVFLVIPTVYALNYFERTIQNQSDVLWYVTGKATKGNFEVVNCVQGYIADACKILPNGSSVKVRYYTTDGGNWDTAGNVHLIRAGWPSNSYEGLAYGLTGLFLTHFKITSDSRLNNILVNTPSDGDIVIK